MLRDNSRKTRWRGRDPHWTPLVSGQSQEEIFHLLHLVSTTLWGQREHLKGTFSTGLPGAALFLGYLSRLPGFEDQKARALELLTRSVHEISNNPLPSFYNGFIGVAWSLEHLNTHALYLNDEDLNADVDDYLLELIEENTGETWDLIDGCIGWGIYAIERLPRWKSIDLLEKNLSLLSRQGVTAGLGRFWFEGKDLLLPKDLQSALPMDHVNLGVAHGLVGILRYLAAMVEIESLSEASRTQFYQTFHWLKDHLQEPIHGAFLCSRIGLDREHPTTEKTRLAWCHGDLGASFALLTASAILDDPEVEELAYQMALLAADRSKENDPGMDWSLCHGSAGACHVFHRWHQATGQDEFQNAALQYLNLTVEHCRRELSQEDLEFYKLADFLQGLSGVGLSLLSAASNLYPSWDKCLLLG